jgi:hypothetical protein
VQSNLEKRNSQAVLRSRGGVRVVRLGPFEPLCTTVRSQPPGPREFWEITLAEVLVTKSPFMTGVSVVTRKFSKRGRMKAGDYRSTRKSSCCSRGGLSTRSIERIATHHPMPTVIFAFLEFDFPSKNFSLVQLVSTKLSEFFENFEK